jgi:hypothetical protein
MMNARMLSSWVVTCAVAMGLQGCPIDIDRVAEDSGDQLENVDVKLNEAAVVATGPTAGGDLNVELTVEAKHAAGLRANWQVSLLQNGYPVATQRGVIDAQGGGEHKIQARLPRSAPDLTGDKGRTLGALVLEYRLQTRSGEVRGRRSMANAWRRQDVLILGSATFDPRSPSLVRVLVRDPSNGRGLPADVSASLLSQDGDRPLYEGPTDENGVAEIVLSAGPTEVGEAQIQLRVRSELATDFFEIPITIASAEKMLVTTDKPLYQPGQTIHIRTLTLDRSSLRPAAEKDLVLEVQDADGNYLLRETLQTDAFGIASWQFPLATQVNTGSWIITARMGSVESVRRVTVDRYKLPRFDARIQLDREAARPGDVVRATVSSRYFFGEPVAGGELIVQASTAAGPVGTPTATLLDQDGIAAVNLVMNVASGQDVQIAAVVTDKTGQQFTARRTIPVSNTDIIQALLPMADILPGALNRFLVLTSSPARLPLAAECSLLLDRQRVDFDTDDNGVAIVEATVPEGLASVQVQLECGDAQGRFALRSWQMDLTEALRDGVVAVETDKALYNAGDTARVLVRYRDRTGSALAGPLNVDILRQGQVLDSVSLRPGEVAEVPIDRDWWGTLQFEAYAVTLSGAVRRSRALAYVAPSRRLDVKFATDKSVYRPGEEARLQVQVTDEEGRPAVAAVGLNIVDEAVYALQDTKPGLEKLTFQIEAPQAHAEVTAHGYSARQIVTGDESRRNAAALAVFSTTDAPGHGIEIHSSTADAEGALAAAQELFRSDMNRLSGRFNTALNYPEYADGGVFYDPNRVRGLMDVVLPTFDPWGQPYVVTPTGHPGSVQGFNIVSAGPDEIGGTDDDLSGDLYANGYYVGVL